MPKRARVPPGQTAIQKPQPLFSGEKLELLGTLAIGILVGILAVVPPYFADQSKEQYDVAGRWYAIDGDFKDAMAICDLRDSNTSENFAKANAGGYLVFDQFNAGALESALSDPVFTKTIGADNDQRTLVNSARGLYHFLETDNLVMDQTRAVEAIPGAITPHRTRAQSLALFVVVANEQCHGKVMESIRGKGAVDDQVAATIYSVTQDARRSGFISRLSFYALVALLVVSFLVTALARRSKKTA